MLCEVVGGVLVTVFVVTVVGLYIALCLSVDHFDMRTGSCGGDSATVGRIQVSSVRLIVARERDVICGLGRRRGSVRSGIVDLGSDTA